MDQFTVEKRLTITYVLIAITGGVTSITSGIAWGHWKLTLDQCIHRNCSCILYGEYTPSKFLGGSNGYCIWVTFGPLFYVLFCVSMTCFHGYRVLFVKKSPQSRTTRHISAKFEPGETVQVHAISEETTSPLSKAYWVTLSTFCVFFTIFSLVHFVIFIDGFYKTCNQYRLNLEKLLTSVHGSALPVVHSRLACQGIFDFMDYMQQDSANGYRNGFINTGLDLIFGIVASTFSWIMFINASFLNIKMSRVKVE